MKEILEGAINDLRARIGMLPNKLKLMTQKRFDICKECDIMYFDKNTRSLRCGDCNCFINWATKTPNHKCPLNKW